MGLDMYLERQICVGTPHGGLAEADVSNGSRCFRGYSGVYKDVVAVICHHAYWRKAYMIDKWFLENTGASDENNRVWVSIEQLRELRGLCEDVLAHPEQAQELLPDPYYKEDSKDDPDGYEQWYMDTIEYTAEVLKNIDGDYADYFYERSW